MSNLNRWIIGVIFICTILLTALITHQLTLRQFGEVARARAAPKKQNAAALAKADPRLPPLPEVIFADEEFPGDDQLGLLNDEQWERKQAKLRSRGKSNPTTEERDSNHEPESTTCANLDQLTNVQKNELWWRIAAVAHRTGNVAYQYSLTPEHARPFALEYEVSIRDIFNFFKSGVKAEWRQRSFENRDAPYRTPPKDLTP